MSASDLQSVPVSSLMGAGARRSSSGAAWFADFGAVQPQPLL